MKTETLITTIAATNFDEASMNTIADSVKSQFPSLTVKANEFKFKRAVDKETKAETHREAVTLVVPYPTSVEAIVAILEKGGKELAMLQDAIEVIINDQVRELLYADTSINASNLDYSKCTWEYIANIPAAERKGNGIPKAAWEAFAADYLAIMPAVMGVEESKVAAAVKLYLGKLQAIKTNKPVLNAVIELLGMYAEKSPNAADHAECLSFLLDKASSFLNTDDSTLLANLL